MSTLFRHRTMHEIGEAASELEQGGPRLPLFFDAVPFPRKTAQPNSARKFKKLCSRSASLSLWIKISLEFFPDRMKVFPRQLNQRKIMTKPIPDGFHTITPHLVVSDAAKAIEFYKKALGAQENGRVMTPDGKAVMHAQLKIGNSMVMLANEFPPTCLSPKSRGGTSVSLHLSAENADEVFER